MFLMALKTTKVLVSGAFRNNTMLKIELKIKLDAPAGFFVVGNIWVSVLPPFSYKGLAVVTKLRSNVDGNCAHSSTES